MPKIQLQIKEPKNAEEALSFIKGLFEEQQRFCRKFTELYIQRAPLKDLEPELRHIFSFKLNARLISLINLHIILCMNLTYDKNNQLVSIPGSSSYHIGSPYDFVEQVAGDELAIFLNEIQKKGIKAILSAGKNGNRKAIYKLVLWNKTALSLNFLVEKIANASLAGDKIFFEQLADAIKKKVGDKREERNRLYTESLRYLIPFFKTKDGLDERQIWRKLTEKKNGILISDIYRDKFFKGDDVPSLDDIDYFVKFLKRKKIVP